MKKIIIIGLGEVGMAHANVLKSVPSYDVRGYDTDGTKVPEELKTNDRYSPDYMLIAIRGDIPNFVGIVKEYVEKYKPQYVNILSTVPPGTCEKIGPTVSHSTTRGLHPNLNKSLLCFVKHVGGPSAEVFSRLFRLAGVVCYTHELAITTEVAHLLNNSAYGVNLMLADEMQKICRFYGVDYFEAVMIYTQSNNEGFSKIDNKTKTRMILTPPNGQIGGHCVVSSAGIVAKDIKTPLIGMLADYNNKKG